MYKHLNKIKKKKCIINVILLNIWLENINTPGSGINYIMFKHFLHPIFPYDIITVAVSIINKNK